MEFKLQSCFLTWTVFSSCWSSHF